MCQHPNVNIQSFLARHLIFYGLEILIKKIPQWLLTCFVFIHLYLPSTMEVNDTFKINQQCKEAILNIEKEREKTEKISPTLKDLPMKQNTSYSCLYSHHSCIPSSTIFCSRTEPVTSLSYYGCGFWADVRHPVNSKCDRLQGKDMSGHLGHICIYSLFLLSVCLPLKLNPTHIPLKVHSRRRTRERRGRTWGWGKGEKFW